VSRDGRYLFRGEAVDLTVDPTRQVMDKIVLDGQPVRGPSDAKVTVVEYSDFQCPFCGRVYDTVENKVLPEYGDRIRFVFKNLPLGNVHPWAEQAALAAECAFSQGNDPFWAMYKGLYSMQGEIQAANLRDKASEIARSAGLDVPRFQECLDDKKAMDAVKADTAEAAALGVTATPTFFINGRRLTGPQTFDSFKQLIVQGLEARG
jgi:protein-disulfide isomerase